jgi:hypothetical protein
MCDKLENYLKNKGIITLFLLTGELVKGNVEVSVAE